MSEKEWTVDERADLVEKACEKTKLKKAESRQLAEAIYTLSEAGRCVEIDEEQALFIYSLVDMIKRGAFTEDMRL